MNPTNPEKPIVPTQEGALIPSRRQPGLLVAALRKASQPVRLARPQVDPDLPCLPALLRVAEVLRYTAQRLEYSLSPGGELRAWTRLNLLLCLLLAIPVVLVMPVVTLFLCTVATWSQYLLTAAVNVLLALLAVAGIAAVVSLGVVVFRFLRSSSR